MTQPSGINEAAHTLLASTSAFSVWLARSRSSYRTLKSECSRAASATTTSANAKNARESTSCSRMLRAQASRVSLRERDDCGEQASPGAVQEHL